MSEVVVSLFHVRDERTVQSRIKEAVEDYSRTYKTEDSQVKLLYESGGKPYLESRAVELLFPIAESYGGLRLIQGAGGA